MSPQQAHLESCNQQINRATMGGEAGAIQQQHQNKCNLDLYEDMQFKGNTQHHHTVVNLPFILKLRKRTRLGPLYSSFIYLSSFYGSICSFSFGFLYAMMKVQVTLKLPARLQEINQQNLGHNTFCKVFKYRYWHFPFLLLLHFPFQAAWFQMFSQLN